jgi:peptidylprolyl isomerase
LKKRSKKLLFVAPAAGATSVSAGAARQEQKFFGSFFQKRTFFLFCTLLVAAAPDPVVAVRGDETLTAAQVRALIAATPQEQRKQFQASPDAVKSLITNTMLQHAILAEAAAQKWDQRPDVAALLARVRETAILQSFLTAHAAVPAGYPAEADVQAAYARARPQLTRPRSYHLAQAFVPVAADAPPGAAEAARRTLNALARDIAARRVNFEAAAKRAPGVQVVDLGWVADAQLQKAARDAVAGLPEGEVSAPVCTENGCTLIKLLATRPAGPPPLADVHDELVRALREQKQKELAQAYENSLLAKTPVRVNEIELSRVAGP